MKVINIRGNEYDERIHEFMGLVKMHKDECIECGCYDTRTHSAACQCTTNDDEICCHLTIKVGLK
jgi:hypothetical protein